MYSTISPAYSSLFFLAYLSLSLSLSLFSHVSCEWRAGRDHEHEL